MNATFYVQVLDHLCKSIAHVRSEMWGDRKFFIFHDNAHSHTATIMPQFLAKKRNGIVESPSYLSDLSPPHPDYFIFPKLNLELKGDHASIKDIQKSVTAKLKASPISDFAMKWLEDRANEYIRMLGNYFQ